MEYYINAAVLTSSFPIPSDVVDRYLKLAKPEHVKVLLYVFRKMSAEINTEEIAEQTGVSEYDVKEALLYWADTGILLPKQVEKPKSTPADNKKAIARSEKPTRTDVAKRGLENPRISFLLREAQLKLGRNLKSNETSTLVWLYEDQGLDVSLILLIVQYAVKNSKPNMRFIESVAVDWVDKGIDSLVSAEEELRKMAQGELCWKTVCSAFGIEYRKPSTKEKEAAFRWVEEWKIPNELLILAYEECVDKKSKFSFAYTSKIIENWHEKGIKSAKDLKQEKTVDSKTDFAAYDLDLYEKMLNSKD